MGIVSSDSVCDDTRAICVACELLIVLVVSGCGFDSGMFCENDGSDTCVTLVIDVLFLLIFWTLRDWNTILAENVLPTRLPDDFSFCASVAGVSFSIMWQVTQTLVLTWKCFSPLT